jgi:hypothetical protein
MERAIAQRRIGRCAEFGVDLKQTLTALLKAETPATDVAWLELYEAACRLSSRAERVFEIRERIGALGDSGNALAARYQLDHTLTMRTMDGTRAIWRRTRWSGVDLGGTGRSGPAADSDCPTLVGKRSSMLVFAWCAWIEFLAKDFPRAQVCAITERGCNADWIADPPPAMPERSCSGERLLPRRRVPPFSKMETTP